MAPLDPHNYLLVMLDIEGYSLRAESDQATLHSELYSAVGFALGRTRLEPTECAIQDRGDGMLMLLPPTVSPTVLLRELTRGLQDALADHHAKFRDELRMRLRVALHMGPVLRDGDRWTSTAVNDLARLVDAQPAKDVLTAAVRAHLVVVVSEELHKAVVVGRHPGIDPAAYLPFDFITKHQERRRGWVTVPGYPAPPGLPPAVGEPSGPLSGPGGAGGGDGGAGAGGSAPPHPAPPGAAGSGIGDRLAGRTVRADAGTDTEGQGAGRGDRVDVTLGDRTDVTLGDRTDVRDHIGGDRVDIAGGYTGGDRIDVAGDYTGGDRVEGDYIAGDYTGGDRIAGDYYGGDRVAGDKHTTIHTTGPIRP